MDKRFFVGSCLVAVVVPAVALFWPVTWDVLGEPVRSPLLLAPPAERVIGARLARPLTLRAHGRNWRLTPAALGLQVTDVTPPDFWQRLAGVRRYSASISWDPARQREALAPMVRTLQHRPISARWDIEPGSDHPVIVQEADGQAVDLDRLTRRLEAWLAASPDPGDPAPPAPPQAESRLVLDVPLLPLPATPTARELSATGVDSLLAVFTTQYDPTIPRAENVAKAAGLLDGYWWAENSILSYNELLGAIRADAGWQEAWVIVGNKLVRGVGGGACQVATTLYDAALLAGLDIVERHPHNLAVAYIDPSRDATVAPPRQDLKLRNNTGHPIYVRTRIADGAVTVWLYGHGLPGRRVEVVSRVLERLPVERRELAVPGLPEGERKVLQQGQEGFISLAERRYWQDGALVRTELLSRDTYPMVPEVIGVST